MQRFERLARHCPGEQHAVPALVEEADAVQAKLDRRGADRAERGGDILGQRPLDFADEAQGDVQLVLALPGPAGRAAGIGVEAVAPDGGGRPKRDEQAMHGTVVSRMAGGRRPVFLEQEANNADISAV